MNTEQGYVLIPNGRKLYYRTEGSGPNTIVILAVEKVLSGEWPKEKHMAANGIKDKRLSPATHSRPYTLFSWATKGL